MEVDGSIIQYFWNASFIVKLVLLILMSASVWSWVIIFQKYFYLRFIKTQLNYFESQVWDAPDLVSFYRGISEKEDLEGIESLFVAGFEEYLRVRKSGSMEHEVLLERVQRALLIAQTQAKESLEEHLPFLATVGSTSPYVGLFGTVWGIMMAFQALGHVTQATIAMVAPGISEALIATAMGLFAAIPAVIAYNRYIQVTENILDRYGSFSEELTNAVSRQLQQQNTAS
jgi:biopolymer transport protein TolQ